MRDIQAPWIGHPPHNDNADTCETCGLSWVDGCDCGDACQCEHCEAERREHQQSREDYLFDQMKDERGGR